MTVSEELRALHADPNYKSWKPGAPELGLLLALCPEKRTDEFWEARRHPDNKSIDDFLGHLPPDLLRFLLLAALQLAIARHPIPHS